MAEGPPDGNKSKKLSEAKRQNTNALIASKLRGYYESIVEEGTPSHLLDLLERLHVAEAEAKSRKP
ncbi:MAG: NepR family anti-sigma factor [Rhizobium sp.]|nr:NepR family anti-sigma factor [Rhizobium sp.]